MVEIAADHEAFRLSLHQPVERQVETELATRQVGAVEPQRRARHDGCRGPPRSAHPGAHVVDVEGPADILGAMLAAVDEGVVDLQLGDVAHGARHGDAAGSAMDCMRSDRLTPSPNRSWLSSSTMTSPRCTPMRNSSFCSSASSSLKRTMRSWMSIAAVTAARAEPNSASIASPVPWTIEPPAISTAGRQTSLFTDLRFLKVSSSSPSVRRTKPARSA